MRISSSGHVAYGIRVADNVYEEIGWDLREKIENALRGGAVSFMTAGEYDEDMAFLVISQTWKELKPGQVKYVGPYSPTDTDAHPYPDWDWELVRAAEKFNLPTLSKPAWMFVLDEG